MTIRIFAIGACSALARAVLPILATKNTIITAGRSQCDIYCDVTDNVVVPDNIDIVINFVASFGSFSDDQLNTVIDTNVGGVLRICQAANKADVAHVINISTIFAVLDEDDPNFSLYALTKRHADELATHYCRRHDLPLTILRPSRIYGDNHEFARGQPFFYQIVDVASRGEDISLYGSGEARRNYIHASDVSEIIDRIIDSRATGIYACANPANTTYSQIAESAQRVFGRGGRIIKLTEKPEPASDATTQDMPLYDIIDFRPGITLEVGIERIRQQIHKEAV
ncbi:NAD-dependent epimerase/dehydratase family protein [Mycobacterium sp. ML4]